MDELYDAGSGEITDLGREWNVETGAGAAGG